MQIGEPFNDDAFADDDLDRIAGLDVDFRSMYFLRPPRKDLLASAKNADPPPPKRPDRAR